MKEGEFPLGLWVFRTTACIGLVVSLFFALVGCNDSATPPLSPARAPDPQDQIPPPREPEPDPAPTQDGMPEDWGEGDADICAHLQPGTDSRENLVQLTRCLRLYWNRFEVPTRRALLFYKLFGVKPTETLPSYLTIREMRAQFADARDAVPFSTELSTFERSRLRSRFTRENLEEVFRLADYRWEMLGRAEVQIVLALRARKPLLDLFQKIDRYRFLGVALTHLEDLSGAGTAALWSKLKLDSESIPFSPDEKTWAAMAPVLLPYSIGALLPRAGEEFSSLSRHPFEALAFEKEWSLAGEPRDRIANFDSYLGWSSKDNPPMPAALPFAADRVRVALLSGGIDFQAQSSLRGLLSPDFSADFADQDSNPWASSLIPGFQVPTWLAENFRRAIDGEREELLQRRQVELGVWKAVPYREIIGSSTTRIEKASPAWGSRLAALEGVVKYASLPAAQQPAVVWTTFDSGFARFSGANEGLLKSLPWLWVVRSGRVNPKGEASSEHCWNDLSAAARPSDRVLCVGSVKRGALTPTGNKDFILKTYYYGPGADVFAYDDYDGSCPDTETCASSQIAAAAAIIKVYYPKLSPDLVRRSILESATTRTIPIQNSIGQIEVKFFDISNMLDRALKKAKKYAEGSGLASEPRSDIDL